MREVLTPADLRRHPVWAHYRDLADRERILAWGVSPDRLDRELARFDDCGPHLHYPVLALDALEPLEESVAMIAASRLETSGGRVLEGWVLAPHAFGVFLDSREYNFNRTLVDSGRREAERLAAGLGVAVEEVFPLRFQSLLGSGELAAFW